MEGAGVRVEGDGSHKPRRGDRKKDERGWRPEIKMEAGEKKWKAMEARNKDGIGGKKERD